MGRFKKRNAQNKVKKEILTKILSNDDLLKYINYPVSPKPLLEKNIKDPYALLNTKIFKVPKDTDVVTTESVVLIVRTTNKPCSNSAFRNMVLTFEIIANIQCIDNLENGDDRMLCIADLIDDTIFDSRGDSWLGKVRYIGDFDYSINKSHVGLRLVYEVVNFS